MMVPMMTETKGQTMAPEETQRLETLESKMNNEEHLTVDEWRELVHLMNQRMGPWL